MEPSNEDVQMAPVPEAAASSTPAPEGAADVSMQPKEEEAKAPEPVSSPTSMPIPSRIPSPDASSVEREIQAQQEQEQVDFGGDDVPMDDGSSVYTFSRKSEPTMQDMMKTYGL